MSKRNTTKKGRQEVKRLTNELEMVNPDAAFVDIGSGEHWVCVPPGRSEESVRQYGAYTEDLHSIRDWLLECGVTSVAMESTGVYWINLYVVLEEAGVEVLLVNARDLKNVKGRPKTDRLDCQWGQRLHSYRLLRPSFRPSGEICAIRSIWRMRDQAVKDASRSVQRMCKALYEMNVLLPKVVSDVTGKTGMSIIKSILDGQRDPHELARLRDHRIKKSEEEIAKALDGNYRSEQIFLLRMALEDYEHFNRKLARYDREVEERLEALPKVCTLSPEDKQANACAHEAYRKKNRNAPTFDARTLAHELTGLDLTAIPGFSASLCICIVLETGLDMSKWDTDGHFASWLGLCPNPRRSAGRDLGTSTKKCASHAAEHFRNAAAATARSHTYVGDFFRRMRARHGGAHAVTATAHKLASLFHTLISRGEQYKEIDRSSYQEQVLKMRLQNLRKRAAVLDYDLVPNEAEAA